MNQLIPSWIYFSRQERRAIVFLAILTAINVIVRYWILPYYKTLPPPQWKSITLVENANTPHQQVIEGYLYDTALTRPIAFNKTVVIEINKADSAELEKLPMIGGFLAKKIVDYREALGGYVTLDQLLEIKYLKEEVWENLRKQWSCNGQVRPLPINTASIEQLSAHPYLNFSQAKRIVHYRMQHGHYHSIEALRLSKAIPDSMWNRILPYLAVDTITP